MDGVANFHPESGGDDESLGSSYCGPEKSVGDMISAFREQSGCSNEQIAQLLGVSRVTIWKWESGQTKPRTKARSRLEKLLNGTVEDYPERPGRTFRDVIENAKDGIARDLGIERDDIVITVQQ